MGGGFLSTEGESNPLWRNSRPLLLLFLLKPLVLLFLLKPSIHVAYLFSLSARLSLANEWWIIKSFQANPQWINNRLQLRHPSKHVIDLHSAIKVRFQTKGTRGIIESWPHWYFLSHNIERCGTFKNSDREARSVDPTYSNIIIWSTQNQELQTRKVLLKVFGKWYFDSFWETVQQVKSEKGNKLAKLRRCVSQVQLGKYTLEKSSLKAVGHRFRKYLTSRGL